MINSKEWPNGARKLKQSLYKLFAFCLALFFL